MSETRDECEQPSIFSNSGKIPIDGSGAISSSSAGLDIILCLFVDSRAVAIESCHVKGHEITMRVQTRWVAGVISGGRLPSRARGVSGFVRLRRAGRHIAFPRVAPRGRARKTWIRVRVVTRCAESRHVEERN